MARFARIMLGVASPLLLLACLVGGGAGTWLFVLISPLVPPALIVLGACRGAGDRRVALVALMLALSLELGAVSVMLLDARSAPWLFGLPLATALMLLAFGVIPLALVPWSHAALFRPPREGAAPRSPVSPAGARR